MLSNKKWKNVFKVRRMDGSTGMETCASLVFLENFIIKILLIVVFYYNSRYIFFYKTTWTRHNETARSGCHENGKRSLAHPDETIP